jgi:hypothetical protein
VSGQFSQSAEVLGVPDYQMLDYRNSTALSRQALLLNHHMLASSMPKCVSTAHLPRSTAYWITSSLTFAVMLVHALATFHFQQLKLFTMMA